MSLTPKNKRGLLDVEKRADGTVVAVVRSYSVTHDLLHELQQTGVRTRLSFLDRAHANWQVVEGPTQLGAKMLRYVLQVTPENP